MNLGHRRRYMAATGERSDFAPRYEGKANKHSTRTLTSKELRAWQKRQDRIEANEA